MCSSDLVRLKEHIAGPRKSGAVKLHKKMQELGPNQFKQTVVERGEGNPLSSEQNWYDFYFSHDARQTLNSNRPGGWPNTVGHLVSIETRAKLSAANIGKRHTEETRAKMSASAMGHLVSEETRAKLSVAHEGRKGKPLACNSIPQTCECGRVINPGSMAIHVRATGHVVIAS